MNARLDFDAALNFTRTVNPAPRDHEDDAAAILIPDADPWTWAAFHGRCNGAVEARIEQAIYDGHVEATHYKRSLAQRARWMLAEHMKETKA